MVIKTTNKIVILLTFIIQESHVITNNLDMFFQLKTNL